MSRYIPGVAGFGCMPGEVEMKCTLLRLSQMTPKWTGIDTIMARSSPGLGPGIVPLCCLVSQNRKAPKEVPGLPPIMDKGNAGSDLGNRKSIMFTPVPASLTCYGSAPNISSQCSARPSRTTGSSRSLVEAEWALFIGRKKSNSGVRLP